MQAVESFNHKSSD